MLQIDQNWELFGYDPMRLLGSWRSAWRDFLWANDSPVKSRLDEVVKVETDSGSCFYQSGKPTDGGETTCIAVVLPEALVLVKNLQLPLAVASNLDSVMQLEVGAHSPFPEADTGYGWRIVSRDENHMQLSLAVVSLSATMTYLGKEHDCHDKKAFEIWTQSDGEIIELNGFGEHKRRNRYTRRLARVGIMLGLGVLCLLSVFGVAAASKYVELEKYRELSTVAKTQAAAAVEMREGLIVANETILEANKLIAANPSPHVELARLTRLLEEDSSLSHFALGQTVLRIRGSSRDAAALQALLNDVPEYKEVIATQPITVMGNTGFEQFFLDINLVEEDLL